MTARLDARSFCRARWEALRPLTEAPAAAWSTVFEELADLYSEPLRHYHTLEHIADLLALSARHRETLGQPDVVDLAIFFHDAIYDVSRHDNEVRSADLARARLAAACVPGHLRLRVGELIEATRHGEGRQTDGDCDLLLDLDLSILAAEDARYVAYSKAIRKEYGQYSDADYARGRAKVLEGFLARAAIFRTPELYAAMEAKARENLASELARLW